MFLLRNPFSLKYKEEILLHKLVIKLVLLAIVEVRLVNNNNALGYSTYVSYSYIIRFSAARDSIST